MSSSTLQLRNYLKENEPAKYEAYLEIQRLLNQQRREKKTEKMATETRMRDTVEAKKGEKELKRKCSRRYHDKVVTVAGTIIKREAASPTPDPVHSEGKERCDMIPDDSRLHDKSKDMLSKTSKLRKHWKENEPEKYKSYLERQRVKNKQQREKKKEKWETETPTRDMVEAKEREAELKRERNRRYRDKKVTEAGTIIKREAASPIPGPVHSEGNWRCDMTPDDSRLPDNNKINMLSKTSKLRKYWKENEPEKYQAYLERQRMMNKQQREKKKEKWETETPTTDMMEEKEREKELKRERNRRYRDKKALEAGKTVRRRTSSTSCPHLDNKRRCDMTPDERRLHDNSVRLLYTHGLSPQEKAVVRRKNRDRMRVVRAGLVTVSKLIKPDKL